MKNSKLTILIASLTIIGFIGTVQGEEMVVKTVTASQDKLLGRYDKSNRVFTRLEIDRVKMVSFFHQRRIGEAIVEKDFIRYQFNTETEELIEEKKQWRSGLPEQVTPVITKEQAESMVEGVVQFTRLYIISPQSDGFRIEPTPKNPCWIVRSIDGNRMIVSIIDAITGEMLGYGVPPPYTAFSLTGPIYDNPCSDSWDLYYENARDWFNTMGYSTEDVRWPTEDTVKSHIQSRRTALFYEEAHGSMSRFASGCSDGDNYEYTNASEIETWIVGYAKMPFTFLGSCDGMCNTYDGTLSYEFRKGSSIDTVTVGYCGMSDEACADCWDQWYSLDWQDELFWWMSEGYTVGYAFDRANLAYPNCASDNCMRIAGDGSLTVVPVITRCLCTSLDDCHCVLILSEGYYVVRRSFTVPSGQTLTIDPNIELLFANNSKIIVYGTLYADGATGQIRLVSAEHSGKGMEFTGQIQIMNGGQIKIYE